jgi:hypothetical protein
MPASINLTNGSNLPISTGVIGLGIGVAATLANNIGTGGAVVTFNGALGSPSSVGAMPAFTLGGTISGGGNNINNVNIGATSPGTGTFTTLAGTASVTSPLHVGGSGPTQPLSYKTTTGVGASGADHIFLAGNNGSVQPARFYNSGAVSLGGSTDRGSVGQVSVVGVNPSVTVVNTTDSATGSTATQTINSSAAVNAAMIANEPSRATVRWGFAVGNWSEFGDFGSGTNGLVLGNLANRPIVFGTNTLERARIPAGGGFNIGPTAATLANSELGLNKIAASGSAPGAGSGKLAVVAGTSAGTCKLIMYAGTSTTPTTVIDNVGAGC